MNKNFAIRGHLRRGDEVIKILEMLGGKTSYECSYKDGYDSSYFFFINTDENFSIDGLAYNSEELKNYYIFTLEEFLKKIPYKVGDKVITKDKFIGTITDIRWQGDNLFFGKEEGDFVYTVQVSTTAQITYQKEDLQPYKEETFGECIEKTINECLFGSDEETMMEGVYAYNEINCYHQDFGDKVRIRLGNDFEIKIEDNVTYIVKKQPQYPKTYEECCEILSIPSYYKLRYYTYEHGYNEYTTLNKLCSLQDKLNILGKLLICRDAYWKIAGEEMGLDEPWKPDWKNNLQHKHYISTEWDEIKTNFNSTTNKVLAFPTEEMRDTFFNNFKELIEQCKELL
jgi:hypothetical protein